MVFFYSLYEKKTSKQDMNFMYRINMNIHSELLRLLSTGSLKIKSVESQIDDWMIQTIQGYSCS